MINYDTTITVDQSYYFQNCFTVYVGIIWCSVENFVLITVRFMNYII